MDNKDRISFIDDIFKKHGTDKRIDGHNYTPIYAKIDENIKAVLEIGIASGASIKSWLEIFPEAELFGVDVNSYGDLLAAYYPRTHCIMTDVRSLSTINLPQFDLIVDDASHDSQQILEAVKILVGNLKGTYVIEDITHDNAIGIMKALEAYSIEGLSHIITRFGGDNQVIMFNKKIE